MARFLQCAVPYLVAFQFLQTGYRVEASFPGKRSVQMNRKPSFNEPAHQVKDAAFTRSLRQTRKTFPWPLYDTRITRRYPPASVAQYNSRTSRTSPYQSWLSFTARGSPLQTGNPRYSSENTFNSNKDGKYKTPVSQLVNRNFEDNKDGNQGDLKIEPRRVLQAHTAISSPNLWSRNLQYPTLGRDLNIDTGDYITHRSEHGLHKSLPHRARVEHSDGNSKTHKSSSLITAEFVRRKIAEYYAARRDKSHNTWMYKLVKGSPRHMKDIFIGRCWDFLREKAWYVEQPEKLDCDKLWDVFYRSFAHKGPCAVSVEDYTPFFNLYHEKPLVDRVMLWSGTRELTHTYTQLYNRFTTLEDTLAGCVLNGMRWCGGTDKTGVNYTACPYHCSIQKAFWSQAAKKLAKRSRGVVHLMLNGTRQHLIDRQIFPAFMDDSYLADSQLPGLSPRNVTELRILVGHSLHHIPLESCNTFTVRELQDRARSLGLRTTCYDDPYVIRHLLCLSKPMDELCQFKSPTQS